MSFFSNFTCSILSLSSLTFLDVPFAVFPVSISYAETRLYVYVSNQNSSDLVLSFEIIQASTPPPLSLSQDRQLFCFRPQPRFYCFFHTSGQLQTAPNMFTTSISSRLVKTLINPIFIHHRIRIHF